MSEGWPQNLVVVTLGSSAGFAGGFAGFGSIQFVLPSSSDMSPLPVNAMISVSGDPAAGVAVERDVSEIVGDEKGIRAERQVLVFVPVELGPKLTVLQGDDIGLAAPAPCGFPDISLVFPRISDHRLPEIFRQIAGLQRDQDPRAIPLHPRFRTASFRHD